MSAAKRIHRRSDRKQKSADHATWSSSRETGIRGRKRPRLCTSTHPDRRPKTHLGKGQVRPPKRWKSIGISDAQADMLLAEASSAICVQRFDDSHTSCNSHYVSHFAAFFIVARAKISVVEGCIWLRIQFHKGIDTTHRFLDKFKVCIEVRSQPNETSRQVRQLKREPTPTDRFRSSSGRHTKQCTVWFDHSNDPSAGSPTETLLRLLLPLNGRV